MQLVRSAILAAAVLAASATAQGINPSSCSSAGATLEWDYNLQNGCYSGVIDHQATGGGNQVVTINVDFPVATSAPSFSAEQTMYAIAVFDTFQGRLETSTGTDKTNWRFSSPPKMVINGAQTNLTGVALYRRTTSAFDGNGLKNYLYVLEALNPSGRATITFRTESWLTDQLAYTVMVYQLPKAERMSEPIPYTFGQQATAASLKFVNAYTPYVSTEVLGYSPGLDGSLVTDLTTFVEVSAGTHLNSGRAQSSSGTRSMEYISPEATNNQYTAVTQAPPAVRPLTGSASGTGPKQGSLVVSYWVDLRWSTQVRSLDVTQSPGPFLSIRPGSTTETFDPAIVLTPGTAASVTFDRSVVSTIDNRATKTYQLFRIDAPAAWWAARVSGTYTPLDGPDQDKAFRLQELGWVTSRSQGSSYSSFWSISSGLIVDEASPGTLTIINDRAAFFPSSSTPQYYRKPLGGISDITQLNNEAVTSHDSRTYFPLYDTRAMSTRPLYLRVCMLSGCSRASSTTAVPQQGRVTIRVDVDATAGECTSNAQCVVPSGGGEHPATTRARAFSARGNPDKYSTCILFAGPQGQPETRCVECLNDCDCNPGEFCYVPTGLESYGGQAVVVDELSRLRSGSCMRKDLNNSILGRRCRSSTYQYYALSADLNDPVGLYTDARWTPYVEGQQGPNPCAEYLTYNNSFESEAFVNRTGTAYKLLWRGVCGHDDMCRECIGAPAGDITNSQCSAQQVCLDGVLHPAISVDGTVRTLANDTNASLLLAAVLFLILVSAISVWWCFCDTCCRRRSKTQPGKLDGATAGP